MKLRLANKSDWQRIYNYVKSLEWVRDGKRIAYRVTIEEIKSTRSIEQNSRYWALLTEISQQAPAHMGGEWHDPEVWHEYSKRRFLGVEAGPYGEGVAKSSKKLGVEKFNDYMTEVEAWAYETLPGFIFEFKEVA